MVSKRSRPYDEPPSPDSSSEEEEEPSPVQTLSKIHPKPESEDEDPEEDDEESEDDDKNPTPSAQTPAVFKQKVPESVSGSDSGTESDMSQKVSSYTIKPIVKEKTNEKAVKVSKHDKSVKPLQPVHVAEDEEDEVEKKALVNRLWSFHNEFVVLQGLIDFKNENNKDPGSNHDEFYDFVKAKLTNGKFTKVQVKDKVKRLKKKYKDNLNKSYSGGKDPEFSNSHDLKSFQLSKRIWGALETNNIADANVNANVNANANTNSISHTIVVAIPAKGCQVVVNGTNGNSNVKTRGNKSAKKSKNVEKVARFEEDMEVDKEKMRKVGSSRVNDEEKDFRQLYPHLMKAFEGKSVPRVPILDEMKSCLNKADSVQLEEWDRKWKKIRLAETDAYMSRLALIQEHTSWFSNAMKSSKH